MNKPAIPRLMWVTDRSRQTASTTEIAADVLAAGVDAIHIRERSLPNAELAQLAASLIATCGERATVIINSNVAVAKQLGTGLHLPESVPIEGSHLAAFPLVGRSVHSPESASRSGNFDYVIAGHVFETASKAQLPPLGTEGLAAIVTRSPAPVLAIGGIKPENVGAILATGAHGIAVMSGIGSAKDPRAAAETYRWAIDQVANQPTTRSRAMPIELTVNGKVLELPGPLTIQEFLDSKKLHKSMVVVEYNGAILKRDQFESVTLSSGDMLEVVHFVGGG